MSNDFSMSMCSVCGAIFGVPGMHLCGNEKCPKLEQWGLDQNDNDEEAKQ